MGSKNPFTIPQWIAWLGATVAAAMSMMSYAQTTFQTKEHAKDKQVETDRRLERIENKIDALLSRPHN